MLEQFGDSVMNYLTVGYSSIPEFRETRQEHDFFTICRTPELACEVTLQVCVGRIWNWIILLSLVPTANT